MNRFISLFFLGFAAGLVLLVALPHSKYYRFQEHQLQGTRKADWIYERLNFDDTPVDVALFGTSRTAGGISGPEVERGYCEATGRRIHVANFAMPQTGRDMDYLLVKEVLEHKDPSLLLLQITEIESRKPHPAFLMLADARDILTAPILINWNWADNLASLAGRQLHMARITLLDRPAVREEFDASDYIGSDMDRTEGITMSDGSFRSRDVTMPEEELDRDYKIRRRDFSRTYMLPEPLRFLEYRLPRVYLDRVFEMARDEGAAVAFDYLPAYRFDGPIPAHIAELTDGKKIFHPADELLHDPKKWLDPNHPNTTGGRIMSRNLARSLAETYPDLGTSDCHLQARG